MTDFDWIKDLILEMYDYSDEAKRLDKEWSERLGNA
jgi:hypothetical protein